MYLVKTRLTSPEAALLLNEAYDREYIKQKFDKDIETVFGSVLKRRDENITAYNRTSELMHYYIKFDINKLFHISYKEFKHMTKYEIETMIDVGVKELARMDEELKRNSENNDRAKKELEQMSMPGYNLEGFS